MATILPKENEVMLIVCDDARPEPGNKITILGYYAGGDINFLESPLPLQMSSLTFIYTIMAGEGTFKTSFELVAPDSSVMVSAPGLPDVLKLPEVAASIVVQFKPLTVTQLGNFTARLKLNDKTYNRVVPINMHRKQ